MCVWLQRREVVAFDPGIATQVLRQARQMLKSGGLRNQLQAGEAGAGGGEHERLQGAKAFHSRREQAGLTKRSGRLF